MPKTQKKSVYSLHPGYAMEASSMARLEERTGKSLEEWIRMIQKSGPVGENERRDWLKTQHGMTTNYAGWVTARASGRGGVDDYDPEALVDSMFSGSKSALRPIYDALLKLGLQQGSDVRVCPCQTIVPLFRRHVFAQIKPRTRTEIDLGFALRDLPVDGKLLDTGGFAKKDRISHRMVIRSVADIDAEAEKWLRLAYELDK